MQHFTRTQAKTQADAEKKQKFRMSDEGAKLAARSGQSSPVVPHYEVHYEYRCAMVTLYLNLCTSFGIRSV